MGFLLAGCREVAYPFQVADDAGHVVHVLAVADGALFQVTLVYVATVVADGIGYVEREVIASFLGRHLQQLSVLLLGKVLGKIHVQGRTARQVLYIGGAMELELVDDVERFVFHHIEIAVVAVAGHEVTILPVPLGVLYAHVLGGYHLAVEEYVLGAILLVVLLYQAQYALHEVEIVGIVGDLQAHELGRFYQSVDADGEILAADVDVASVEEGQHAMALQLLEVLVVGQLHLVAGVNDVGQELQVVHLVVHGILHAAVEVDGEHALGAG